MREPLFEKCTIYDGGARRYEIWEHIDEVLEFREGVLTRKDEICFKELPEAIARKRVCCDWCCTGGSRGKTCSFWNGIDSGMAVAFLCYLIGNVVNKRA